uniref:Uncharacterized protein n=1 Tax=Cacopsylla melanoneura TaxID=428564 RepID=A0A8D8XYK3_9HEMI
MNYISQIYIGFINTCSLYYITEFTQNSNHFSSCISKLGYICFASHTGNSTKFNIRALLLCFISSHVTCNTHLSSFIIDSYNTPSFPLVILYNSQGFSTK